MVEQLSAGAQHQALRYRIDFTFHVEILTVQSDQEYPKVRAAQIQRQEVTFL